MKAVSVKLGEYLSDPKGCPHEWQPLSFVFETQVLDERGRVCIRQPDIEHGRAYLMCVGCAQHTYISTNWVEWQLCGCEHRAFDFKSNSSHPYSIDNGKSWQRVRPDVPKDATCEDTESEKDSVYDL